MRNAIDISRVFIVIAAASLIAAPTTSRAAKLTESNLSLFLGQKKLDNQDWDPVDGHTEWGFIADLGRKDSVVNLVASFVMSEDNATRNGSDFTGETWELGLGLRKVFRRAPDIAPYVEAGVAFMDATLEQQSSSSGGSRSDNAFGVWAGAGAHFAVGERLTVGVNTRYTSASATLLGQEREVGGIHFGVTAGIGF